MGGYPLWVVYTATALSGFFLVCAMFCFALSIATSRLEEYDSDPERQPHRPVWR